MAKPMGWSIPVYFTGVNPSFTSKMINTDKVEIHFNLADDDAIIASKHVLNTIYPVWADRRYINNLKNT